MSDEAKLVYVDGRFGTVSGRRCDCISHRTSCPFLKFCDKADEEQETVQLQRQTSVSWKSIPFLPTLRYTS